SPPPPPPPAGAAATATGAAALMPSLSSMSLTALTTSRTVHSWRASTNASGVILVAAMWFSFSVGGTASGRRLELLAVGVEGRREGAEDRLQRPGQAGERGLQGAGQLGEQG